ncbi:BRCT domain-containing protein [Pectobacterium sp. A5351]|uniref:BRCT domain-containing protein n=1 Tax=Pectobacterium sp. A5351 TaxID=2914983 RepID=UPI00233032B0|nr:BRCT domain-containing protein [Pectobacterium sp. A5351]WCG84517.1 BRCT domain-containing protein [Pectobacterium sp. A5351]
MLFDEWKVSDNKEAFFIYVNAKNEKSPNHIVNLVHKDGFLQGYSINKRGYRTYSTDRIVKFFNSEDELFSFDESFDKNEYKENPVSSKVKTKKHGLEICFTGFDKSDKDELTKLAKENDFIVRAGVTAKLYFLCCGANAGWKKIKEANEKGCFILTKQQFLNFIETGEIPLDPTDDYEIDSGDILEKIKNVHDEVITTFRTVREPRRSSALLAVFVDGYASGWKFAVGTAFRDALDIKLTKVTFDGVQHDTWTQGNSFAFHRGDSFYSDRLGYSDWASFIKLPHAVLLKVKYDCYAGYETLASIDGKFTGDFIPYKQLTPKPLVDLPILIESQSYDAGVVTLEIYKPNDEKNKVTLWDTVTMTQDDLVALLQTGFFWKKEEGKKAERINLFSNKEII